MSMKFLSAQSKTIPPKTLGSEAMRLEVIPSETMQLQKLNSKVSAISLVLLTAAAPGAWASGDLGDARFSFTLRSEMNQAWKAHEQKSIQERKDARNGIGYAQDSQLKKLQTSADKPWGSIASQVLSSSPEHQDISGLPARNDYALEDPKEHLMLRESARIQSGDMEFKRLRAIESRADDRAARLIAAELK